MGIWARLFGRKSSLANPAAWLVDALGGSKSASGMLISPDSAMRSAAVYACVRVLAESVAQLPLILYRRTANGGKERAVDHPLYRLLHDAPNDWQTSFEYRELQMHNLLLRGNAFAFVNRVNGTVRELLPILPDRVTVKQSADYVVSYEVATSPGGAPVPFRAEQMHRLCGLSANGVTGLSPIGVAREAIGLALATEQHGAKLFTNGARLGGVLRHPGTMSPEAQKRLGDTFDRAFSGENALRTAVLEEGLEWTKVSMTADDAQFLETRKFQVAEIARIFRVPPHKIGDLERATFSNIEHQALEFVTDSLLPWLRRWEQAITRDLLSDSERAEFFAEFLVDGLLRGDAKTRMDSYAVAIQNGIMNPNEARIRENMNPREGGDEFMRPANMLPAGAPAGEAASG